METWYTTTQAAERLGVSKGTVHRWLDERLLEGVYIRAASVRRSASRPPSSSGSSPSGPMRDGAAIHRPR